MSVKRMDNVLIVVDDLEAVKAFFIELGLKLEGEQTVEGPLVGKLIGLKDVRATLAMMRTPDGQGIELDKFHTPDAIRFGPVNAPVNTLGIRRLMFAVDNIGPEAAKMMAPMAAACLPTRRTRKRYIPAAASGNGRTTARLKPSSADGTNRMRATGG